MTAILMAFGGGALAIFSKTLEPTDVAGHGHAEPPASRAVPGLLHQPGPGGPQ
jgi:hypothetical protein